MSDASRFAGEHGPEQETVPPAAGTGGPEQLVQEGLEHLQGAARETIAAMRALLDLAEKLVEDPRAAEMLVGTIGSLAEAAVRSGADLSRGRRSATAPWENDGEEGGVQRIPLS